MDTTPFTPYVPYPFKICLFMLVMNIFLILIIIFLLLFDIKVFNRNKKVFNTKISNENKILFYKLQKQYLNNVSDDDIRQLISFLMNNSLKYNRKIKSKIERK